MLMSERYISQIVTFVTEKPPIFDLNEKNMLKINIRN